MNRNTPSTSAASVENANLPDSIERRSAPDVLIGYFYHFREPFWCAGDFAALWIQSGRIADRIAVDRPPFRRGDALASGLCLRAEYTVASEETGDTMKREALRVRRIGSNMIRIPSRLTPIA